MTPPPWLQFFKFKYLGNSSKATNYLGHSDSPKAFKVNKIATEHYTQENENSGHHENIIRENSDQQKKRHFSFIHCPSSGQCPKIPGCKFCTHAQKLRPASARLLLATVGRLIGHCRLELSSTQTFSKLQGAGT